MTRSDAVYLNRLAVQRLNEPDPAVRDAIGLEMTVAWMVMCHAGREREDALLTAWADEWLRTLSSPK